MLRPTADTSAHSSISTRNQLPCDLDDNQISANTGETGRRSDLLQTTSVPQAIIGGGFNTAGTPSESNAASTTTLNEVFIDNSRPKYFEVCVNTGGHAIGHIELDITKISTDSDLFKMVWNEYNLIRGYNIKRFVLKPCGIHFVMVRRIRQLYITRVLTGSEFSINSNRKVRYSAGIHRQPEEYPPIEEVQQQRYHYLAPKIIMPSHIFLHYLHRANSDMWGDHANDTWLKRLPKKLNESILAANDVNKDSDLLFGWGVHIVDGPNHFVLGSVLAAILGITFLGSSLVAGIARTQEQAFGVGQYLVAIIVALMSAVYFKLQGT